LENNERIIQIYASRVSELTHVNVLLIDQNQTLLEENAKLKADIEKLLSPEGEAKGQK